MIIPMPLQVKYILNTLNNNGYESYVVGGAIRNSLLNIPVKDWDVTTNALPNKVLTIFEKLKHKVIKTGLQHGTVTVIIDNFQIEVTTFRIDGEYSDGRHPDSVLFTTSLKEDLSRRDFTVNALAYGKNGLVDYFNGLEDLKNKVIECVGKAEDRFREDALRMLRAVRFSAQLGFTIHSFTLHSIEPLSENILKVSQERIRDELSKILTSNNIRKGFTNLQYTTLLNKILPELEECTYFEQHKPHHCDDVFGHTLSVVENIPNKLELRLSALFHDIAKPKCFTIDNKGTGHFYDHAKLSADLTKEILIRLRFDNKTIDKVCKLIYNHMTPTNLNDKSIKKLIARVGKDDIYDLIELMIADRKGMAKEYQEYNDILELKNRIESILNEKQPLNTKDLAINGNDLKEFGFRQGKIIGETLAVLLEKVLENPNLNNKEDLIKLINIKKLNN